MIRLCLILLFCIASADAKVWRGLWLDTIPEWRDSVSQTWRAPEIAESDSSSLTLSGYKSIRLVTGESGTEITQEMRLGLQGEAAPGWFVEGRLVDEGLQAGEMRVTTLQQVDEMFLKIHHAGSTLTLGDLRYEQDSLALFGTDHRTMGLSASLQRSSFSGQAAFGNDPVQKVTVVFAGQEGQRSGYLIAQGSAPFIAVVPGSESVFFNGGRLRPGTDYKLDPVGGVLDFVSILPTSRDLIRVEYEAYGESVSKNFAAADWHWKNSFIQMDGASVGEWTDMDELNRRNRELVADSSDSLKESPENIRLAGGRVKFVLKDLGLLSLEGAVSRFDSSAGGFDDGRAARWFLARTENWGNIREGANYHLLGSMQSSQFQTRNHIGNASDWEQYELRENWELDSLDSTVGYRVFQQGRIGYSPDGTWRPWIGAGYREGEAEFYSKRMEAGLDHLNRKVASKVRLSSIEAEQVFKRRKLLGEWNSEVRQGLIRPFGNVYSGWRQWESDSNLRLESGEVRANSGFRYGQDSRGFQGSLDFSSTDLRIQKNRQKWNDSTNSVGITHRLDAGRADLGVSSLLQWKRLWESGPGGAGDSWLSDQQGHWDLEKHDGHVSHKIGLTREHPLERTYRRVADGTGDVSYDSLLQQWIEGVDYGDWEFNGWSRNDSLPIVEQSEVALILEEWINTGLLFQVSRGILRDIRLGVRGEWSRKDTMNVQLRPPFLWSDLDESLEGTSMEEGLLQWNYPGGLASWELKSGRILDRKWNWVKAEEKRWWQGSTVVLRIPVTWEWELGLEQEEVQVIQPTAMNWVTKDIQPKIRKEFWTDWHGETSLRIRTSTGASDWGTLKGSLLQPGIAVWKEIQNGTFRIDYSYTNVEKESEWIPYRILDGFAEGWTHRIEARANYRFQERLSMDFAYLWRKEEGGRHPFQKVSGEARAYF